MPQTRPILVPRPRHLEWLADGAPLSAEPTVAHDAGLPAEGFRLEIAAGSVHLAHADAAGLRHARGLLAQLVAQSDGGLPGLRVRDWPDFPVRGYMLDVSRDRVPTRQTLERIVDLLALLRINHLQLYTEHSFAYAGHETVWRDASPITPEDVRWLDALCAARGIELVANQNCFGHMARWLRHPAYRDRAETPDGWRTSAGKLMAPTTLAPTAGNAELVVELCRELLACHSSRRINIGCDETFELGRGRSRADVAARGAGRVFLEHLRRIAGPLLADGCEVLFWGDVARKHPELVPGLPELTALVWHYEAPGDPEALDPAILELLEEFGYTREALRGFEGQAPVYAEAGRPWWVCPGTSTWNTLIGRLPNARGNLLDAARTGAAHGAGGYLITDWGDSGHMQPPSVSFPPLVYGAAVSWCLESNRDLDLPAVLDTLVLDDAAGELGGALEDLGSAYLGTGQLVPNGSPLFTELLVDPPLAPRGEADPRAIAATLERLAHAAQRVERSRPACADAGTVRRELLQAIRLARHGAWRLLRAAGGDAPDDATLRRDLAEAIAEQRACWALRSRPGGLDDSVSRLEETLATYRDA